VAIRWKMSHETAERAYYLQQALDNYEIDANKFREELAKLPGYPLTRLLQSGDNLVMEIQTKAMSHGNPRSIVLPKPGKPN